MKRGAKETAVIALLAFLFVMLGIYSGFRITANMALDDAQVFAGRENYTVGDMAHIFVAPSGIDYDVEVYGPDEKLYAAGLDFPVEKPGRYSIRAVLKKNGMRREIFSEFVANEAVEKEKIFAETNTINTKSITGSIVENETDTGERINLTVKKIGGLEGNNTEIQTAGEVNDTIKDNSGEDVGRKVEDEQSFETFFEFAGKVENDFVIRFYHNSTSIEPVWVEWENELKPDYTLSSPAAHPNETITLIVPLAEGRIPRFRLHVGLSSEVFEFGVEIEINAEESGPESAEGGDLDVSKTIENILPAESNTIKKIDVEFAQRDMRESYEGDENNKNIPVLDIEKEDVRLRIRGVEKGKIKSAWFKHGVLHVDSVEIKDANIKIPHKPLSRVVAGPRLYMREDGEESFRQAVPYEKDNRTFNSIKVTSDYYEFNVEHFTDYTIQTGGNFLTLSACLKYINNSANDCQINAEGEHTITKWQINASASDFNQQGLIFAYDVDIPSISNSTHANVTTIDARNEFNGTLRPFITPIWRTGKLDNAVNFDGKDDYIETDNVGSLNISRTGNFTIMAWVMINGTNTNNNVIISRYVASNSWTRMYLLLNGGEIYLMCETYNPSQVITGGADLGAAGESWQQLWQHYACTYNGTVLTAYVNGASADLVDTGGTAGSVSNMDMGWDFGALLSAQSGITVSSVFNGSIDEVRIYNRSLEYSEVNNSYLTTNASFPDNTSTSGLIGYWNFNATTTNYSTDDNSGNSASNIGHLRGYDNARFNGTGGVYGASYKLDGYDDWISVAAVTPNPSKPNLTITGWIKLDQLNKANYLTSAVGGIYFGVTAGNILTFGYKNASAKLKTCNGTTTLDNNWHFISAVVSNTSGTVDIYLDGKNDTASTCEQLSKNGNLSSVAMINKIGVDNSNNYLNGSIDQVKIYNRTLSQTEIEQLYAGDAGKYNLSGKGIEINSNNVMLNCNNSVLKGIISDKDGITTEGQINNTIRNCYIDSFRYGFYIVNSEAVTIENSFIHNSLIGIYGVGAGSRNISIKNNTLDNNNIPIGLLDTTNATVDGNTINLSAADPLSVGFGFCVLALSSVMGISNTTIINNTFLNCTDTGITLYDSIYGGEGDIGISDTIISGNTFLYTKPHYLNAEIYIAHSTVNNTQIWLNSLYTYGINNTGANTNFCVNGKGNFYEDNIDIASGDCGPANFTIPLNGSYQSNASSNNLNITWKVQNSQRAINYTFHYSNNSGANWYFINATTDLSLLWSLLPLYDNTTYMLRAIPYDGLYNGTWVNVSFTIDRTKPNIALLTPADSHNQSNVNITLYYNASDIIAARLNCSLYARSLYNKTNSSVTNYSHAMFNLSNLADNDYWFNITCWDLAGNVNSSENRTFRIDTTPPTVQAINSSPFEVDKIDPVTLVNVTANISDLHYIDTAMLQYKRGVGQWSNITMTYNSSNLGANASFTTEALEGTYSLRLFTNDSVGNVNISHTFNITSYYEYTWAVTPTDLGTTSGLLLSNKNVGNLTINNTGDDTLLLDFTDNLPYDVLYNDSTPFYLAAKEVKYYAVNATFAPSIREDAFNLTLAATHSPTAASPLSTIISAAIITYAGGPYLSVSIKSYKAAVVQSESGILLSASIKNLGNETATNTTLNWTLPTGWLLLTGNLSQNISNLTTGTTAYNNITVKINATAEAATKTIAANGSCYGCTDNYDSKSVIVSCNSTDSICGMNCTASLDLDCVVAAAAASAEKGAGGGGGAGGGSAGVGSPVRTGKVVEGPTQKIDLVRGTEVEFPIEVTNSFVDASLENVKLDIAGYLLQYITVEPKQFDRIGYQNTKVFTVKIKAPAYMKFGNHTLDFVIVGDIVKKQANDTIIERLKETRKIILAIQEASSQETNDSIISAESAIEEMKKQGFNTAKISKILDRSKDTFSAGNYRLAKDMAARIVELKEISFRTFEMMNQLKKDIDDAESNGIKVIETNRIISLAQAAFEREDYETAQQRIKDAQLTMALETKGKFNVVNFVLKHIWQILAGIMLLSFIGIVLYGRIRALLIINKLRYLDKEELAIKDLIKNVQTECFEKKKLTVLEFHKMMYEYNKRLDRIRHKRIELRSKRVGLIIASNELKNLQRENDYLLKLMSEVQKDYFERKTADWETYTSKIESLSDRRVEVEKSLAMLEAKTMLEKRKKEGGGYVTEAKKSEIGVGFEEMVRREEEKAEKERKKRGLLGGLKKYFDERAEKKRIRKEERMGEKRRKKAEKERRKEEKRRQKMLKKEEKRRQKLAKEENKKKIQKAWIRTQETPKRPEKKAEGKPANKMPASGNEGDIEKMLEKLREEIKKLEK